jgi:hypothetical protein
MKKRQAKVILQQQSIDRLFSGKPVIIRLEDIELELRFDPSARTGGGSLEDMFAEAMHMKRRG